jgi:hypothetical protein
MGLGFNNPPEDGTPPVPDIPVPDYASQAQQFLAGLGLAGAWDDFWRGYHEHKLPGGSLLITLFASALDDILAAGMKVLTAMQGANTGGFFDFLAATLHDLTGVEFSSTQMQSSFAKGGTLGANANIGGQFLKMLTGEMQPTQQITPESGFTAASAFLGYSMNFAIREANLAVFAELLPIEANIFGGLREYGEGMADALGLGRLTRLAMAPIMKVLVADPLTWYFNQQYRPTLLPVPSMFKALWRGGMQQSDVNTFLGYLGYSAQAIEQLEIDAATLPPISSYVAQTRTGLISTDDLKDALQEAGIRPDDTDTYLNGIAALRAEADLQAQKEQWLQLYRDRWIDHDECLTQLQALGLYDVEVKYALGRVAPYLENTHRELSQGEVEQAFLDALVGMDYVMEWATRQGYNSVDQQILQYALLLKQKKEVSASQISAWRLHIAALTAVSKGEPPPPGFDSHGNPIT